MSQALRGGWGIAHNCDISHVIFVWQPNARRVSGGRFLYAIDLESMVK